jgi:drug/metabolite transporter (DMT)-like permease
MTEQNRPRWLLPVAGLATFAFCVGLPAVLYNDAVLNSSAGWLLAFGNLVVPPIVAVAFKKSSRERLQQAYPGVLLGWGVGFVVGFAVCFNAFSTGIELG